MKKGYEVQKKSVSYGRDENTPVLSIHIKTIAQHHDVGYWESG